ncbi:MAG: hypothetical protein K1Y36_31000, partial [Blastocatellia bacterium]|nr:hypothetical protein [Blastocatellia bacterium]
MKTPLVQHLIPVRRRMFLIVFLVFGCLMTVRPGLGWMDAKKQPSQPIKEKPQTPSPAGVVGVPAGPATNLTTQPNFTIVNSPAELIAAMNNPAVDAIYLYQPGSTYTLTARDNGINGHNGLPNVTRTLSIYGFGCTIEPAANAPTFRAFHVTGAGNPNFPGADGRLYLYNVRLRGFTAKGGNGGDGYEPGGAGAGLGGAIFNYGGTVELRNCTLDSNLAQGGNGGNGRGKICWGGGGGLGGNGGNGFHGRFP